MVRKVGFIGLGLMGRPMSKRILKAGYELVVYSRSQPPVEELVSLGAEKARNPREVAEKSEIIITMLPDSPEVKQVITGPNGVAEGANTGSIVIDMSTISPLVEMEIAEELRKKSVEYLDAPVTGSTMGAEAGTLTIMVGGDEEAFNKALPVLKTMGQKIVHMGGNGMGQMTKICNQIAVALNLLATCEAILFASKAGLNPRKVIEVIGSGAAGSWQLNNLGPKIVEHDFTPGFKIQHFRKDLKIVKEMTEKLNLPLLGVNLVSELVKSLENKGMKDEGTQALITILEEISNYKIK
ncbi:MAG TPA: NAD(P)-dependent oxidoreductase [Candidatus Caldiarchaeum subterraneum]|uniref:NAD(P)-dependent oxidoreductase n=1 Tax=Caldiarchaeum subterraneum TaxID=311458 RepID=A0A832ZW22_CALS0|nr:NAD(P)-dependent oxidoreductase [Candidatus Caldarchaeum subterraneum]